MSKRLAFLEAVDLSLVDTVDLYGELPLWSAPFGRLLLERVPLGRGLTILDVGAGTGFLAVELAQRCGPTATVIAVDPWASALARLRRKVAHLGLVNVRILEQDAATIDLPDASVDVVVSNLGVNNFENAEAVLATCFRLLKPGGSLILTSNLVGHMQEFYDVYREVLLDFGRPDCLLTLDANVAHRASIESLTLMLARAGFEPGAIDQDRFRMRFADGSSMLRHSFIRLGFLPAWREVATPEHEDEIFEALERALNAVAAAQGELALTIPMACVEARRP